MTASPSSRSIRAARTPSRSSARARAPWQVMQRVDHPDPAAANAQALHDLENGATGLALVFAGSIGAYGYGLDASAAGIAARARRRLPRRRHRASSSTPRETTRQARRPSRRAREDARRSSPAAVNIRFGFDPLGAHRGGRRRADPVARSRRRALPRMSRRWRRRASRAVRRRRRPRRPQCRRLGGAGARLRAGGRASPICARWKPRGIALDAARAHDLLPPRGRCRPVPDHRQVPRAAETVGARRAGLRRSHRRRSSSPPRPRGG